jgi:anti-sigma factor RsiW
MISETDRPSEDELHAFADGLLDAGRQSEVRQWLENSPQDAARIAEWQAQSLAIRAAFSGYARSTAEDAELLRHRPARGAGWRNLAAGLALFVAGAAAGHYLPTVASHDPQLLVQETELPDEARAAYLIYASEVRHPVEVAAAEEAHLATWLGKRLSHANLKVPNLSALGFHLVGGRLVPVEGQAGALFMYEDDKGKRLTLLVGRNAADRQTSFRFAGSGKVDTFYWIDNGFGYAITGEVPRDVLRQVAEETYRQLPA